MQPSSQEISSSPRSGVHEWLIPGPEAVDEDILNAMTLYFLRHSQEWRDADDVQVELSRQWGKALSSGLIQAGLGILLREETLLESEHKDGLFRLA